MKAISSCNLSKKADTGSTAQIWEFWMHTQAGQVLDSLRWQNYKFRQAGVFASLSCGARTCPLYSVVQLVWYTYQVIGVCHIGWATLYFDTYRVSGLNLGSSVLHCMKCKGSQIYSGHPVSTTPFQNSANVIILFCKKSIFLLQIFTMFRGYIRALETVSRMLFHHMS